MADAVISGLVKDLLGRLTSAAIQEYGLLRRLKDDILTLSDDFYQIQAVIEDAEEKHMREKAVELWLKSLRSASLKMENLLDEVPAEALLRQLHKELGMKHRLRAFFSSDHNQLMFRTRIAHKVKAIRRKLADISAQRFELNLYPSTVTSPVDGGIGGGIPNRETSSLVHSSTVFGRSEEIKMVTEKICNPDIGKNDDNDIRVYAIWGMGGLGKTTLVQSVYNHERVKEHFDLKCWMYVSENFQVKDLIRGIIESIDKHETIPSQLDEMQKCLQDKLRGKIFLVVLDDVWIENSEEDKWEDLSKTLSCGAEGSIVVMTTRSKTTSRMMAKVPELLHELGCISQEDSWWLFKKFAFAEGREGGDITLLEPIGKKIVEKCKGLPLAVKTLGGLMWSKGSTRDWQRVMDNDIWELQESNILPALKLSYDYLLPQVKRCFAYCCMLPKGHEMGKDLLILLWKANRLIPSSGEADWYVTGEEIFNSLVWRSFIQFVGKEYKMHDLMHDLAQSVMKHDCLIIELGKRFIIPDEVLHLSLSRQEFPFSLQDLEKLRSLRSVFIFAKEYEGSVSYIFDHVYLRVLYLAGISLKTLPESICKLKHLKYLNLSRSLIEVLPESIIYLQNLQVLLLNGCRKLKKLPKGMRYMRNLEYLDIDGCDSLRSLPVGIGKLTCLRRLSRFPLRKNDGAKIGELGNLNLIGPDLRLEGLKNVGGLREAQSANLKSKTSVLVLGLSSVGGWGTEDNDEEVLEGLEPNPSLEELIIFYYNGRNISPSWMVNLRSLVQIQFSGCTFCEHIPPLGKLPSLRVIRLQFMSSLKGFHDEDITTTSGDNILFPQLEELIIDSGFELINLPGNLPKLKVLSLRWCRKLVSLPNEIQSFKDLNILEIRSCEKLVSLPDNLPKLKVLTLDGCEKLVSLSGNLPKLEVLYLNMCSGLVSLPDGIQSFKDLIKLEIRYSEKLVSLPGNLPKLKVLSLRGCRKLVSLPGNLPKLQVLDLNFCEGLVSLPDEIQSFKDLNTLKISECENLRRRYAKDISMDWPKISHIPHIVIH